MRQAAVHDDDHHPVDGGGVVGGRAFIVAYGTVTAVDPARPRRGIVG
jgi:hypothetical protein